MLFLASPLALLSNLQSKGVWDFPRAKAPTLQYKDARRMALHQGEW